jgi:phage shock protein PspC (stress-responsive transcriptional regulator)
VTEQVKKLYRSEDDRMIAGVAGGLGEFLDIDSTIIRLIFAFSILLGGTGLLVYAVMWLIVPEASVTVVKASPKKAAPKKTTVKKTASAK